MENKNNNHNTKEMESLKSISTLPTNDVIFHFGQDYIMEI